MREQRRWAAQGCRRSPLMCPPLLPRPQAATPRPRSSRACRRARTAHRRRTARWCLRRGPRRSRTRRAMALCSTSISYMKKTSAFRCAGALSPSAAAPPSQTPSPNKAGRGQPGHSGRHEGAAGGERAAAAGAGQARGWDDGGATQLLGGGAGDCRSRGAALLRRGGAAAAAGGGAERQPRQPAAAQRRAGAGEEGAGMGGEAAGRSRLCSGHGSLHSALLHFDSPTPHPSTHPPTPQEVEETKATCALLQKDREQLIDHNAALAERADALAAGLARAEEEAQRWQAEAAAEQKVRALAGCWLGSTA